MMAFIKHMNDRLNQWATWSLSGRDGALGYPHQAAFTRMASDGGFKSKIAPDVNEAAWEVEQAVIALPFVLQRAIQAFYLGQGSMEHRAKALQCSRDTLYSRVEKAHAEIMDWLNDYYCNKNT